MPLKYIATFALVAVVSAAFPYNTNAAAKAVPSGTLAVSACVIGSAPSKIHPAKKDICDSQISWATKNATSAYIVITGGSPYLKSIYPHGYTTPGGTGLNKSQVPFWTPAGTYTVSLYVNGKYPTQKKVGTGTKIAEKTITVLPASLLEAKPFVAKNGIVTIQQPKGWEGYNSTSHNKKFFGMSATQVEFYSDTHDYTEMKVSRLDNVPQKWEWSTDKVAALVEKGHTTRLTEDELYKLELLQSLTNYEDTADVIRDNGSRLSKLVSKKVVTINGVSGHELVFVRETAPGYDSETKRHIILKKGNTYFEIVVIAPSKTTKEIQKSVDAAIQTLSI